MELKQRRLGVAWWCGKTAAGGSAGREKAEDGGPVRQQRDGGAREEQRQDAARRRPQVREEVGRAALTCRGDGAAGVGLQVAAREADGAMVGSRWRQGRSRAREEVGRARGRAPTELLAGGGRKQRRGRGGARAQEAERGEAVVQAAVADGCGG